MSQRGCTVLVIALLATLAGATLAQDNSRLDETDGAVTRRVKAIGESKYGEYQQRSAGSTSDADGVQDDPVTLEAGQGNGKGSISWKRPDCTVDRACWAIKLSAPTDKDSESTDFTTLDGLAKDLTLGFDWRTPRITGEASLLDFFDDVDALCDSLGLEHSCDDATIKAALEETSDAKLMELNHRIRKYAKRAGSVWFVKGKVSYNRYEFFDRNEQAKKTSEFGSQLKIGYASSVGSAGRLAFTAGAQRAYKESKTKAQLCDDVPGSTMLQACKELPLGEPDEEDSVILQTEYRHYFDKVRVSPLVSRDLELNVWGLELPVYFLRNKDKEFTGGFKVGWRSDTDEVVASVFVSKPLEWPGGQ